MENKELRNLIRKVQLEKAEGQTVEVKAAKNGYPTHLYPPVQRRPPLQTSMR